MVNQIDIRTFKSFPHFKQKFLSLFPNNAFKDGQEDSCWCWLGYKENTGYGRISWGEYRYGVHQMSYIIFNGIIPNGKIVLHTCDNKACLNPRHLILGNHQQNGLDTVQRTKPIYMKLNEECVKVIKWMLKYQNYHGLSKKLADLHGVHISTISDIKRNKTWYWVKI